MGIDLEIRVGLDKIVEPKEFNYIKNLYSDVASIDGDLELGFSDIDNPERFAQIVGISSCTRYYGKHYERGPFINIYGTIKLLEKLFKNYNPIIFYDGDSSDTVCQLDDGELEEILEHFAKVGESPYRNTDYNKNIKPNEA